MEKVFPAVALLEWTRCESDRAACEVLGINPTYGTRWRKTNRCFTAMEADEFCGRLRIHPSEVWPNWFSVCVPA